MDVSKYNIYRKVNKTVRNSVNDIIWTEGVIVHCVEDLGSLWLAKPKGSSSTPRMLPKDDCEQITN